MSNTTSSVLGGGDEEFDWRGNPIQKQAPKGPTKEQIQEQTRKEIARLEAQIEALKSTLVDNEGSG